MRLHTPNQSTTSINNNNNSINNTTNTNTNNHPGFKKFFHVTRPENKKKRDTQIYLHIPEIKQLVEAKKTGKTHIRVLKPGYKLEQPRYIFEPSVQISERLGIVVTHANTKKGAKRHKHISSI